jgi:hypothetical protein
MPPYFSAELSSSAFDLFAGVIVLALTAESQPERKPEGGWYDFLTFLGKGDGLESRKY